MSGKFIDFDKDNVIDADTEVIMLEIAYQLSRVADALEKPHLVRTTISGSDNAQIIRDFLKRTDHAET